MRELNPMKSDVAFKIIQENQNKYEIITENGEEFYIFHGKCSCGHENDYTPSMTEGFESAYKKRRSASCAHHVSILNAKNFGPCSNCGNMELRREKMHHQGRHVMNKYICSKCGNTVKQE